MPALFDTTLHRLRNWLGRLPLSHCALCGHACQRQLCPLCHQRYFGQPVSRCRQCALACHEPVCEACQQTEPAYDATIVAADYLPPVDSLVLGLKFGHRLAHAALFGELLRDALLHAPAMPGAPMLPTLPTLLLPVPLGRARLIERGFNQALEIAKPLSRALGVPLARHALIRTRETGAQSGLAIAERGRNMRGAFALDLAHAAQVNGQHIGLVDDVMTTGNTLNEAAALLKRHGALRVTNLVLARTPPPEQLPSSNTQSG